MLITKLRGEAEKEEVQEITLNVRSDNEGPNFDAAMYS